MSDPNLFLDHSPTELQSLFRDAEIPAYRIAQIRGWLFAKKTDRIEAMSDLSKTLRRFLVREFGWPRNDGEEQSPDRPDASLFSGRVKTQTVSQDTTQKLLLEFPDRNQIECVLLRDDRNHRTGCISTQVGCAMGCVFCASGLDGFVRNLSRGEILEQILRLNLRLEKIERLTHLVIMGTGEPLLNLEALLPALDDAIATDGLDLSARRITISTVGIPKGIERLARCGHPYKLAVSLHAPNDELRSQIVPQNRFSGIAEILKASELYFRESGRRVTFEYVLIRGKNDRPEHARELARLLEGRTAIVNLIPFNPVPELPFETPSSTTTQRFVATLQSAGIQVKVRYRKGDRIDAACGQLRRRFAENGK